MKIRALSLIILAVVVGEGEGNPNPEAKMTVTEMIEYHGYPAESHYVTTADGYIINLHRIPHGKSGPSDSRPVIYLQHGFTFDSAMWVWAMPGDKSLPYLLADEGYDVWLGNVRGNNYCRNHTTLTVNDKEFWEFSFEEMAMMDLPTAIDYALNTTGAKKLHYVGHSMGTTIICTLLALKPEYNDKIKAAILLAPVTLLAHMRTPMKYMNNPIIFAGLRMVKHGEMPFFAELFDHDYCRNIFWSAICAVPYFTIFGPSDSKQYNASRSDLLFTFYPSSTSVKNFDHFMQIQRSNIFARYDYEGLNRKIYNQSSPPKIDLTKVTARVAIVWADNDYMVTEEDMKVLAATLPNVVVNFRVNYTGFSHMDLITGTSAVELVYLPVIEMVKKYP